MIACQLQNWEVSPQGPAPLFPDDVMSNRTASFMALLSLFFTGNHSCFSFRAVTHVVRPHVVYLHFNRIFCQWRVKFTDSILCLEEPLLQPCLVLCAFSDSDWSLFLFSSSARAVVWLCGHTSHKQRTCVDCTVSLPVCFWSLNGFERW